MQVAGGCSQLLHAFAMIRGIDYEYLQLLCGYSGARFAIAAAFVASVL